MAHCAVIGRELSAAASSQVNEPAGQREVRLLPDEPHCSERVNDPRGTMTSKFALPAPSLNDLLDLLP